MTNSQPLPLTVVGEEIAGPWNAAALADIALAFGGTYIDYGGQVPLRDAEQPAADAGPPILASFDCLIAAENVPQAESAYMFRPPRSGASALMVGNEARGLRRHSLKLAHHIVCIPLPSRNINCVNVAAAAAVMLAYFALDQPLRQKSRSLASIASNRPAVLLVGGPDHMELGSTLRSVCAFGWDRVFLDDRANAWYECNRRIKSEGRGAARRGRNPIRVLPYREECLQAYRRAIVFTDQMQDNAGFTIPLTGHDTLIVLEDESACGSPWTPPPGWKGAVHYASLPLVSRDRYHYRQMSAIALAEAGRQLGHPGSDGIYLRSRRDRYRREMKPDGTTALDIEDLTIF